MSCVEVDDGLRRWGLGYLSPEEIAGVLVEVAGRLGELTSEVLARHEVYEAAAALRDGLVEALAGVEQMTPYETHRVDARRVGPWLERVVLGLRHKAAVGDVDLDPLALRAYEDELADRGAV